MARPRMVTRTVVGTECEVQIVTISASEITTIKVSVGGTFDDTDKLMKAIKKQTETDDLKVLKIVSSNPIEKCFGMLESEFMQYAKELDPNTRKAIETGEADNAPTGEAENAPMGKVEQTAEEAPAKKNCKKGDK